MIYDEGTRKYVHLSRNEILLFIFIGERINALHNSQNTLSQSVDVKLILQMKGMKTLESRETYGINRVCYTVLHIKSPFPSFFPLQECRWIDHG